MFYFYAKYFNGFRDLKLISDPRMYITLLVIMKHTLEAKGCIYLNQVITANIAGKINTRTIRNTKYLTKVRESSVHKNTLKKKYRDLINARIDGMSYKEIASKLAMNELAVKGDLNKARQKLKQKTDY